MSKNAQQTWQQIERQLAQKLRELPPIIGNEVVNFTLNNFKQKAWSGHSQEVWKKRKNPTKWGKKDETQRALLVKSGKLRRSIRYRTENYRVWVMAGGSDVPYARAHNYGFRGKVQQTVRPFTRKMKDGTVQKVKGFKRTIHQNIPRRQFIGGVKDSPYLKRRINRLIKAEFKKIFQ